MLLPKSCTKIYLDAFTCTNVHYILVRFHVIFASRIESILTAKAQSVILYEEFHIQLLKSLPHFLGLISLSNFDNGILISVYSGTSILQRITISETMRSTCCTPVWRCLVMPWPSMRSFYHHVCSVGLDRKIAKIFPVYTSYYNKLHVLASTVCTRLRVGWKSDSFVLGVAIL